MMGRGPDGGGSHQLGRFASVYGGKSRPQWLGLEIYSHVLKVLSVRNTSRDDLEYPVGGALALLSAPLSLKVSASIDSRRKSRAKKTQPRIRENGPESKKRQYAEDSAAADSVPGQFWTQMEDYFREVTPSDVQLLLPTTDAFLTEDCTVSDPCLLIPPLGRHYTEKWAEEDALEAETATHQVNTTRLKRKSVGENSASKKSKKLSGEVITTIISPPPENEDEEELCHVCNGGDSDESNAILFCDVCNVAVHQDCYGVRSVPEGQWLCSWCSWKATQTAESLTRECVLCPVVGGALKPVGEVGSNESVVKMGLKFAHLFCSQWVPETYIGNMEAMEPIRNVEGVRDERWRLLCSVCKEKRGACIQCSHGMCATAFHPLCARDAKHIMEVSSRQDSEDVELRAYCSKHSTTRLAKVSSGGDMGMDGSDVQDQSPCEDELAKKPSDAGMPADSNISDVTISAAAKQSEEKTSSPIAGAVKMDASYEKPPSDSEKYCSQLPALRVTEMDAVHDSGVVVGEVPDSARVALDKSAAGEQLNFPNQSIDQKQVPGKSAISRKLSISALRIARQDIDPTSEGGRGQAAVTTMGNGTLEASTLGDNKSGEERRQCGLSGEGSSSHSLATSPSDSPAITPPVSSSPLHHTLAGPENEKERAGTGTDVQLAESTWVSKPCSISTSGLVSGDTEEKANVSNAEKVCRKSVRQPALRTDVGKISIANMEVKNISTAENGAHSSPPVKAEEAEYCRNQGFSKNKGTGMLKDTNGNGCETNEEDQNPASTFQAITTSDTSEEVSQTEAVNAHTHQVESFTKVDNDAPKAYTHPHILKLMEGFEQMSNLERSSKTCSTAESDGHVETESALTVLSRPRSVSEATGEDNEESIQKQWEQLEAAESDGVLKLAPEDEIEGEILVLQDAVLSCAKENRGRCERLISKLIQQVAEEHRLSRRREQELAFVQNYLSQAREFKKLGRKERRDKEAQAVLAAATAAAAASPRVGYVKRDASTNFDTDIHLSMPSLETSIGHSPGLFTSSSRHSKPPVPKPSKLVTTPVGSPALFGRSGTHARSNMFKTSVSPKPGGLRTGSQLGHAQGDTSICDICNGGETTRVNRIVACDSCKVFVHQDCYGIGRFQPGVWLCQPCAELQRLSHNFKLPESDVQTKFWVQCALCCRRGGAFKRSTDNRWVHVFCAQWMPGTSVGEDQAALIQGLENVTPDRFSLLCSICQKHEGACLTCNFEHCSGAFHPTCAREAGLYMSVRVGTAGQLQYRAYCDEHSVVQRAKDELAEERERTSNEELLALREIRVEFERVRLICERICRRERLKRDFLQVSKDLSVAQLMYAGQADVGDLEQPLAAGPFASQRESPPSNVHYTNTNVTEDQITDYKYREEEKELLRRQRKLRKVGKQHGGTRLLREKLMTPIEASMQNMRLPKGYAYVPVDVFVKGTLAPTQSDLLEKQRLLSTPVPSQLPDVGSMSVEEPH